MVFYVNYSLEIFGSFYTLLFLIPSILGLSLSWPTRKNGVLMLKLPNIFIVAPAAHFFFFFVAEKKKRKKKICQLLEIVI